MMRLVTVVTLIGLIVGCSKTYITNPAQPTASQSDIPVAIVSKVEFRVTGNAQSVRVRYSNERDGLVQVITTLPYFTSFTTTQSNLFVSLEVTPIISSNSDFPFLNAQIFVNGDLFREASSTSPFLNTITVDGTWRR